MTLNKACAYRPHIHLQHVNPAACAPSAALRCRAAMLDALQKIGMRHRPSRQRWATEILKATRGEDLTRLKAYVDDGGVSAAGWDAMPLDESSRTWLSTPASHAHPAVSLLPADPYIGCLTSPGQRL